MIKAAKTEEKRLLSEITQRVGKAAKLEEEVNVLKRRKKTDKNQKERQQLEKEVLRLEDMNQGKKRKLEDVQARIRNPVLPERLRVIREEDAQPRVSKFDVVLRQAPLRAVHVMHTILTRMVMFHCVICNERFPTFHPAYVPPAKLDMHLLRKGKDGVAPCNLEVAEWTEVPPLSEASCCIAKAYTGTCLACRKDMEAQRGMLGPDGVEAEPVPRRSYLNNMDPNWNFPRCLEWLFRQATVTEACLVALDFMQVNFCTVRRTMMHVFKKNTISFPQDSPAFFTRMEALKQFRVDDRVNSRRGPGGDAGNPDRPEKTWRETSEEERARFTSDSEGRVVFPATVLRVRATGTLK